MALIMPIPGIPGMTPGVGIIMGIGMPIPIPMPIIPYGLNMLQPRFYGAW